MNSKNNVFTKLIYISFLGFMLLNRSKLCVVPQLEIFTTFAPPQGVNCQNVSQCLPTLYKEPRAQFHVSRPTRLNRALSLRNSVLIILPNVYYWMHDFLAIKGLPFLCHFLGIVFTNLTIFETALGVLNIKFTTFLT